MVFYTKKASPKYANMSLDDLWFGDDDVKNGLITSNETNTVTICAEWIPLRIRRYARNQAYTINVELQAFIAKYKHLYDVERHQLYRTFYVPKSSGGLRRIDAPNDELMNALRDLKFIFETRCGARSLYHTSAFAYINGRSTIDCVRKHQNNKSKWFGKFDVHNFFGSTTLQFVMQMFSMVYPFSEVVTNVGGAETLAKALDLCFLDGVLPQGTPISPLITNIMMIPIDYTIEREMRERHLIYTRYADDFLISSRNPFKFRDVEELICDALRKYQAPFELNSSKTRYGSAAGANWNFGIMLNKDNQMTIGRKKKKHLESMLTAYAKDKKAGMDWEIGDVQQLAGMISYYKMVEGDTIVRIIEHISGKQGVRITEQIKADLRR